MMIRQDRTRERIYPRLDVNALGERERRARQGDYYSTQKTVRYP
jgi:hypothetical protein